jgi:hypothetical protein
MPDAPRWTDPAWLDTLRVLGDPMGDDCARRLKAEGVTPAQIRRTIEQMKSNDRRLPADAPKPMRDFFDQTYHFCGNCGAPELPAWVDRDRIIRGQQAFMERSLPAVLVMLCKSLPEGYAAPSMAKILNMSGDLKAIPFHRLMGTLQLLLNVSAPNSFERMGLGAISGQEMRLLHAGSRTNVAPNLRSVWIAAVSASCPHKNADDCGVERPGDFVIRRMCQLRHVHEERFAVLVRDRARDVLPPVVPHRLEQHLKEAKFPGL